MAQITNLQKARTLLSMMEPFFSSILFKHEMKAVDYVPLAAVTQRGVILYNEEECNKHDVDELVFLLAHEVLHVAFSHAVRRGMRDHEIWNIAADAVINETLIDLGVGRMIEGGVRFPNAEQMSVEDVYDRLIQQAKRSKPDEPGEGDKTKLGKLRDLVTQGNVPEDDELHEAHKRHGQEMSKEEIDQAEAKAKIELAEARAADRMSNRQRGRGHSNFARMIDELLAAKALPWYEQLSRYMTKYVDQGISWRRPNKRFTEVYLPVTDREPAMGNIVIGVDTSGSISAKELSHFQKHTRDIIEQCRPEKVIVLYCDDAIGETDEFTLDEEFSLHPCGGGGTDMREITDWCNNSDEEIEACIIFTDGYTPYPDEKDMHVETIWVMTTDYEPPEYINTLRFKLDEDNG